MEMIKDTRAPYLKCRDFTLSGEAFELRYDGVLEMLVTVPQPSAEELARYYQSENYISHTDSRRSFMDKVYQWVKNYMADIKLGWISEYKSGGRLLDLGAGTGDFLLRAKSRGWEVSGVEPSEKARVRAAEKGVQLFEETERMEAASYDVISLWHVLEHIPDLDRQIQELERLLKEDGLLVIAVPNYKSADAKKYGAYWAAYDVPRHLWHFSRTSISSLFGKYGFSVIEEKPLKFDSYYVSLLSEKYRTGEQNYFRALLSGLKSNLSAKRSGEYSSIAYLLQKSS